MALRAWRHRTGGKQKPHRKHGACGAAQGLDGVWGEAHSTEEADMLVALHPGTFGKLRDLFYVHV